MKHPGRVLSVALVLAALGAVAWQWRAAWWPGGSRTAGALPPAAAASDPAPVAVLPAASAQPAQTAQPAQPAQPASGPAAAAPVTRHPIEAASAPAMAVPAPATLAAALAEVFRPEWLATIVQTDDFARRVVATVDNLGREKAPARLWPLSPPAGRFTARRDGDTEVLAAENFVRYSRHMAMLDELDLRLVAATYKHFYPQFQQAYEELGFPGRHFNDRVVEVIDLMLAAPEPTGPVAVRLPAIQGPIQPQRPWLLYEFADPRHQALPAGPQLMLRMGPEQQRRVKARLRELRQRLVRG